MADRTDDPAPDWRCGVRPDHIRIGDAVHELSRPQPAVVSENRPEQRLSRAGGGPTEWFVNEAAELRQNFTLDSRPAGPAWTATAR